MKKLILITSVFLSTSLWADMDKVCFINFDSSKNMDSYWGIADYIGENCERDNIVYFGGYDKGEMVFNYMPKGEEPKRMEHPFGELISYWCRYDRNVSDVTDFNRYRVISCVLYSNKPREIIE